MDTAPTHPHALPLDELAGFDAGGAADLEVPLEYLPVVEGHFTFLERRAAAWDYLFALTEAEFPPDPAASGAVDPSQAGPSVPSKHGQPASDTNTSTNTLFYGGWQEAGSGSPADANPLAYWEQLSELDLNMMFAVDGEQPLAQNRNGDGGFEGGESVAGKDVCGAQGETDVGKENVAPQSTLEELAAEMGGMRHRQGDVVHYREEANPNPNFEENQVFDQAAPTDDGSTLQENLWDSGTGVWAHPEAAGGAGPQLGNAVVHGSSSAFQDNRQEVYETALSPTDVGEPASEGGGFGGMWEQQQPGNALRPAPFVFDNNGNVRQKYSVVAFDEQAITEARPIYAAENGHGQQNVAGPSRFQEVPSTDSHGQVHRPSGSELPFNVSGALPDPAVAGLKRKYEDGPQFSAFHAASGAAVVPAPSKRAKSDDVPEKLWTFSPDYLQMVYNQHLLNILGPRDQFQGAFDLHSRRTQLAQLFPEDSIPHLAILAANTREVANQFATWRLAMWEKGKAPSDPSLSCEVVTDITFNKTQIRKQLAKRHGWSPARLRDGGARVFGCPWRALDRAGAIGVCKYGVQGEAAVHEVVKHIMEDHLLSEHYECRSCHGCLPSLEDLAAHLIAEGSCASQPRGA
ncbi:unnamed protein product [Mycena citricolor]|uniref:Uncharacterized protein n=1 Tax=Mycena citricolor TaxID=2018698 RepID=A0AAD2HIE7_9AGAR|nr:unnamed protein product [Mycena citricolor]CAK5276483.1 unnamed protein product [Mycena citricolor]